MDERQHSPEAEQTKRQAVNSAVTTLVVVMLLIMAVGAFNAVTQDYNHGWDWAEETYARRIVLDMRDIKNGKTTMDYCPAISFNDQELKGCTDHVWKFNTER